MFDVVRETSTTAVVDGHNGMGHSIAMQAMELAINENATDCEEDEVFTIYTEPSANAVNDMVSAFENAGYTILSSGVEMLPQNYVTLDEHKRETFDKMIDKLNESDDVIDVIHNLEE